MSDEYVPTTEEIREYIMVGDPKPWEAPSPEVDARESQRGAAFDRWIADHNRRVAHAAYATALVGAAEDGRLYEGFDSADRHTIRQRLMDMARRIKQEADRG